MKIRRISLYLSLILLGIFVFLYWRNSQYQNNTDYNVAIPKDYQSLGIDISHHQGKVDWELLLDNDSINPAINFVYLKATEGTDHTDRQWDYNRKTLLEMNVKHGAYHFFKSKKLPAPQAAHFLHHWIPVSGDLPPVLDVETEGYSDEDLRHKIRRWLTIVEDSTGMRPVIYTSRSFYRSKFKGHFPGYKFWIASYSFDPKIQSDSSVIHWQFTEKADLPFHKNVKVDLNVSKIKF